MNEQIKELAKQSGAYFGEESIDYFGEYYPAFVTTDKMNIEKFVELIVKECKELLFESSENNRLPIAVDDMTHIIDIHFGKKELKNIDYNV